MIVSKKIEQAIAKGLRGGRLGALLTGRHGNSHVAKIAGCAMMASFEAFNDARKQGLSVLIEEKGKLVYVNPDGSRTPFSKNKKS